MRAKTQSWRFRIASKILSAIPPKSTPCCGRPCASSRARKWSRRPKHMIRVARSTSISCAGWASSVWLASRFPSLPAARAWTRWPRSSSTRSSRTRIRAFPSAYLDARALVREQFLLREQPGAAAALSAQGAHGRVDRRHGHDRAGRGHGRARHEDHGPPARRPLRVDRSQDVHHQRAGGGRLRALRAARGPSHHVRDRAQLPGLLDQREDPQDGHALLDHERAHPRGSARARGQPARRRGRRHHQHDAQPRDRAPGPGRDEPGDCARAVWR